VIPRACSSGRESRYRASPADLEDIMELEARSESVSVVFPWSTGCKMESLRTVGYNADVADVWGVILAFLKYFWR
jgi:hypothetical protein